MPKRNSFFMGNYAKPYQGIEVVSAAALQDLGAYFEDEFGRRFRYCKNGGVALVAGHAVQSSVLAGATTTLQTLATVAVASLVGDTRIFINALTTAQAASLFKDGMAAFYDASTVGGYFRLVKDNNALATTGTVSYIDLYEPLPVALTVSDTVALSINPYSGLIVVPVTTPTGKIIGVVPCDVPISNYMWVQTIGWAALHLKDGAVAAGKIKVGGSTAGTGISNTELLFSQDIGIASAAWADESCGLVYLQCE
jgi:hypothetical protein